MRMPDVLGAACSSAVLFAALAPALLAAVRPGQSAPAHQGSLPALSIQAQEKLDRLRAAARAAQFSHNAHKQSAALNQLAEFDLLIGETATALEGYNEALTLARASHDGTLEAAALNGIASCYVAVHANEKAAATFQQALDAATAAGDEKGKAAALTGMGWANGNLRQFQKALDLHNQALAIAQQLKDPDLEALVLNRIGTINDDLGNNDKALDFYNQALARWRAAGNLDGQGKALNNLGILAVETSDPPKALDYFNQALLLYHQAGDRAGEAGLLNNMGILYRTTGNEQKALSIFRQILPLQRSLGNQGGEAAALNNLGNVQSDLGENTEALNTLNESLALHHDLNDLEGEAGALHNISEVFVHQGEFQKALEALQQALAIWTSAGERRGQADTLNAIGVVYDDLGQPQQALSYYMRALDLYKNLQDSVGAANVLNDIAGELEASDQKQNAIQCFNLALQFERAAHDRDGEARILNNLGLEYEDLPQKDKARESYEQALQIWREVGDRRGEALALDNLGSLSDGSGDTEKARSYYAQALPLATSAGDPIREAQIFHHLMMNQKAERPPLAIFYGKQAVNLLQHVRGAIQGLDPALQRSFIASKNDDYHDLAALLIAQGRLPEAQQVLDLLKEQEFADYVRGETDDTLKPLTLTPAEQQAKNDYDQSTAQIVALGEQWAQLGRNNARTAEQDKTYRQLSDQLDAASKSLNDYYAHLYSIFGNNSAANRPVAAEMDDVSQLKEALADQPRTVALYTLVGKNGYSVIVITGATAAARSYAIDEADLNAKVAAFQQALRDPARDPRPLASELYSILVAPIAADLQQANAETLVWSLDGVLRYVPIAALYDGSEYLVKKYNIDTITPASILHLTEDPATGSLSAAAMGISLKYEQNLPALPAVATELDEVVTDAQSKDTHGALPGTILLNGVFTETAMENLLERHFSVVHIASHFVFMPGNDTQSYLLLAGKEQASDGYHLTVADFRDNPRISLRRTELLTLSACETGMNGASSDGREIDGLGITAQRKGAKAVISSLWEVNDASTGALMADFYKRWSGGAGKVTKVEALRQAQLDLLDGKIAPQSSASGRGISAVPSESEAQPSPAGYAHPYYWAPFVLMGNWK